MRADQNLIVSVSNMYDKGRYHTLSARKGTLVTPIRKGRISDSVSDAPKKMRITLSRPISSS